MSSEKGGKITAESLLPANVLNITNEILDLHPFGNNDDEDDTVYLSTKIDKIDLSKNDNDNNNVKPSTSPSDEYDNDILDIGELPMTDSEDNDDPNDSNSHNQIIINNQSIDKKLPNADTQVTTQSTTDEDRDSTSKDTLASPTNKENIPLVEEEVKNNDTTTQQNKSKSTLTKVVRINDNLNEEDTKIQKSDTKGTNNNNKGRSKADVGSRTMEQWLNRDNLIVHPVWIGNLPRNTTVNGLRHFVESNVGRVLVSIHISIKQQNNERTYAFLNLPTAEKQLLAVTLLDGKIFTEEKLIVRPKRPSKFPHSFFGSSPISEHFKHFRDCVVPAILANPTINLNVTSVRKILEQNRINIDHLPNRVWCVQCTLVPQCHRTYCSFYHCHQEKELGRIISILAAQHVGGDQAQNAQKGIKGVVNENGDISTGDSVFDKQHKENLEKANNPNTIRSRHTLLIQGLPRSITSKKIEETFEVFGEIDNVIVNPDHTCYVRMKRSQDARKIVHLFKYNHAGVIVDFAPYGSITLMPRKNSNNSSDALSKPKLISNATEPNSGTTHHPKPKMNRSFTERQPQSNNRNNTQTQLPIVPDYMYNNNNNQRGGGYNNNHNNNNKFARPSLGNQKASRGYSAPIPNTPKYVNNNPQQRGYKQQYNQQYNNNNPYGNQMSTGYNQYNNQQFSPYNNNNNRQFTQQQQQQPQPQQLNHPQYQNLNNMGNRYPSQPQYGYNQPQHPQTQHNQQQAHQYGNHYNNQYNMQPPQQQMPPQAEPQPHHVQHPAQPQSYNNYGPRANSQHIPTRNNYPSSQTNPNSMMSPHSQQIYTQYQSIQPQHPQPQPQTQHHSHSHSNKLVKPKMRNVASADQATPSSWERRNIISPSHQKTYSNDDTIHQRNPSYSTHSTSYNNENNNNNNNNPDHFIKQQQHRNVQHRQYLMHQSNASQNIERNNSKFKFTTAASDQIPLPPSGPKLNFSLASFDNLPVSPSGLYTPNMQNIKTPVLAKKNNE